MEWKEIRVLGLSVVISSCISSFVTTILLRRVETNRDLSRTSSSAEVVSATGYEVRSTNGRVMARLGARKGFQGEQPTLQFFDTTGRQMSVLTLDDHGFASLSFASDLWDTGAVTLGHSRLPDDLSLPSDQEEEARKGAWGLFVLGRPFHGLNVGVMNDGRRLTPEKWKNRRPSQAGATPNNGERGPNAPPPIVRHPLP